MTTIEKAIEKLREAHGLLWQGFEDQKGPVYLADAIDHVAGALQSLGALPDREEK